MGDGEGGERALSLFHRLQERRHILEMKPILLSGLPHVKSFITSTICHISLCIIHVENSHLYAVG